MYSTLGDHYRALDFYERAIKTDKATAGVYTNQGVSFRAVGEIDRAIAFVMSQALNLEPDAHSEAYFNLGNLFKEAARFEEARDNFDKAVECNPNYQSAHWNKSLLLLLLLRRLP